MENSQLKDRRFWKHGEFLSLVSILLAGFYFMSTNIGHRIDRVEDHMDRLSDRLTGVEKDMSMIKGMLSGTKFRTEP